MIKRSMTLKRVMTKKALRDRTNQKMTRTARIISIKKALGKKSRIKSKCDREVFFC